MKTNITINCNEKKNGVEVRFNFDLKSVKWTIKETGEIITLYEVVSRAFFNAETNRTNYYPKRQYYYVKRDTEMFNKVVWLLKTLKKNNYTMELKELSRSMAAPRTTKR